MADIIVGHVRSVVFNQGDYYILDFDAVSRGPTKAKGSLYGLLQVRFGVPIKFTGKWVTHSKYGKEFQIQKWEPWAETPSEAAVFLSVCIEGFSDLRVSDALTSRYGLDVFQKLAKEPAKIQTDLADVLPTESLERALLGWGRTIAQRDLSVVLKAGGLTVGDIQAVMAKFGSEAAKVVVENPFRLMEIVGISYAKVDRLATRLGVDPGDPRRLQGAILWSIQEAGRQGHLFLKWNEMTLLVNDILHEEKLAPLALGDNPTKAYQDAIRVLLEQKSVVLDAISGLYVPEYFNYERASADLLSKLLTPSTLDVDSQAFVTSYEKSHQIQLSEAQRRSVDLLVNHKVLVITGLPGTGKTTVLRALVQLLEEAHLTLALMAPTGIAAKRLASVTGHDASTVHRALKYDGSEWGYHSNNRYLVDGVILDEASMMDQELLYRLLSALRPDTRLVLVGDDAQLPSVGPGNVLRELVECEEVPHVRLTEIFRQSSKSEIVINSHRINSGKMPELTSSREDSEFKFVRVYDESRIAILIIQMASKLKARNANFQVLSPKYDGTVGVDNLNSLLRDALNPSGPDSQDWDKGPQSFRRGDRLMVTANDYKLNVYNGDVGKLVVIGKEGLIVRIHGVGKGLDMDVPFPNDVAKTKLRLAYAITAHKSQGSEFDTIIMPIVKTQGRMLQRNLLYTAVTRARKRVWLIGDEMAIQLAVNNNKVVRRNTVLAKALIQSLAAGVAVQNNESVNVEHLPVEAGVTNGPE